MNIKPIRNKEIDVVKQGLEGKRNAAWYETPHSLPDEKTIKSMLVRIEIQDRQIKQLRSIVKDNVPKDLLDYMFSDFERLMEDIDTLKNRPTNRRGPYKIKDKDLS